MKKEEFSYDKAMMELESIVKKIESGECKIDELTIEVQKAASLISQCKQKLQAVEADVSKAFGDFDSLD